MQRYIPDFRDGRRYRAQSGEIGGGVGRRTENGKSFSPAACLLRLRLSETAVVIAATGA
ncbi:MAG: hypothetical protein SO532_01795 [Candidatus Borkfalkiaceae bacterium]|nr:hypothetical protein [Christensenellaceae bacterium]